MQFNDWFGIGLVVFLVFCGIYALSHLGKPYEVTTEEFERRVNEGPGLLGASLIGIQKALDPAAEKASEVQQDLRAGHLDGEQESGEGGDDKEAASRGV
jgi:hypothetical protein